MNARRVGVYVPIVEEIVDIIEKPVGNSNNLTATAIKFSKVVQERDNKLT